MKMKYLYHSLAFCALLVAALSTGGCYKDQSTQATFEIPELRVSGLDTAMHILFGQEITLSVTALQDNRTESDFTYLWEMDFHAGDSDERIVLSEEKTMSLKVNSTPSAKPYAVTCTVTDTQTGIFVVKMCRLYVQSALGEGLLVAYDRDGTYDIDLVASESITYGFKDPAVRYTRGVYSLVNDETVPDKILSMNAKYATNGQVYNDPHILIGTEKHLFRVDPQTFKKGDADEMLFSNVRESSFRTTGMWNCSGYASLAIVNGNLYGNTTHIDNSYSKVPIGVSPSDFIRPDNLAFGRMDQGWVMAFNETVGKFYACHGAFISNSTMTEVQTGFGIDLSGSQCLGSGPARSNGGAFLIKTADGNYYIAYLYINDSVYYLRQVTLPEADDIVSVAFCDNVDIMYYTTSSSVYAVVFGASEAVSRKLSWTPDSDQERITMVKHYVQAWWGSMQYGTYNAYPYTLPTNRTQILIVTHNDTTGEGKIYVRPFNLATGMLTYKNGGTFDGFGEITAIAPTFV